MGHKLPIKLYFSVIQLFGLVIEKTGVLQQHNMGLICHGIFRTLKMNQMMLLEMKNVWELSMVKPTMQDVLETGPEIETMIWEWDSFAKNNLVSNLWGRLNFCGSSNQFFGLTGCLKRATFWKWLPSHAKREFWYAEHVLYLFKNIFDWWNSVEYKTCFYCYSCS